MHRLPRSFAVALTGLYLAAAAPSQTEAPGQASPAAPTPTRVVAANKQGDSRPPFVFEAGEVNLRDLVDRCAAYLRWNILVSDQELSGAGRTPTVALQQPVVTDEDGCEELLSSLLWTSGLALVPLDEGKKVYEVLFMNGPRQREIASRAVQRTPAQVLARPNLRMWITTVYPLTHTNATIATNALRPFFASAGGPSGNSLTLGNVGNNTAILLSGPQNSVASAIEVLKAADVPPVAGTEPGVAERLEALTRRCEELAQQVAALQARLDKLGR
ncbi:MAG: hypothetical protein KDC48_10290 [Planctomycetes bacterium]|nr:hypothetical protein [Planctomycetota bacterium]